MITISDALPVQFWPNGEQTFNEKAVCGIIKQDCYCQSFEPDDEITIQLTDPLSTKYSIQILDLNDAIIDQIDFIKNGDIFSVSISLNNYSPITSKIKFIIGNYVDTVVDSNEFTTDLEDWVFQFGGGSLSDWIWSAANGGSMQTTTFNTFGVKNYRRPLILPQEPSKIRVTYNPIPSPNSSNLNIQFTLQDGPNVGDNIIQIINEPLSSSGIITYDVTTQSYWEDTTSIKIVIASSGFVAGDVINFMKFEVLSPVFTQVAKSDCINITESGCTKLIEYSNASNFDGIEYPTVSPYTKFYIRIPATFYEEENPQEEEDLELSNGVIVTLRQSIQEKSLLETGYMPNYMHKKLQKVLMHETIIMDGDQWKRRDPYETNPIKKYNLKRGSVQLTKYNSVLKNTI